jgi:hypothetical protein
MPLSGLFTGLLVAGGLSGRHTLPEPPRHRRKSASQSKLFKPDP